MTDKTLIGGPIRILRLLSRMNVGGPSIHVINLTRSLADHGFETRLVVGEPPLIEGSMIPLARQEGIEPRIIAGLTREIDPVRDAAAFAAIVSEIREFRPHIVETHTAKPGCWGGLPLSPAASRSRRTRFMAMCSKDTFHPREHVESCLQSGSCRD